MNRKSQIGICFFTVFLLLLSFQIYVGGAFAATIDTGLGPTAHKAGYDINANAQTYIGYGIQAVLGIVGAIFFAIIVYGGLLWMLSEGVETRITKAQKMVTYAVAGLIIVLGAYTITNFVTTQIAEKVLQ